MAALKIPKKVLLDLKIQVIDVSYCSIVCALGCIQLF